MNWIFYCLDFKIVNFWDLKNILFFEMNSYHCEILGDYGILVFNIFFF
jgi:hypothetical protein